VPDQETRTVKCPRGEGLLINVPIPPPYVQNRQTLDDPRCINCQLRVPEAPPTITLIPKVKNFSSDLFIDCGDMTTRVDLSPPVPEFKPTAGVLPRGSSILPLSAQRRR